MFLLQCIHTNHWIINTENRAPFQWENALRYNPINAGAKNTESCYVYFSIKYQQVVITALSNEEWVWSDELFPVRSEPKEMEW